MPLSIFSFLDIFNAVNATDFGICSWNIKTNAENERKESLYFNTSMHNNEHHTHTHEFIMLLNSVAIVSDGRGDIKVSLIYTFFSFFFIQRCFNIIWIRNIKISGWRLNSNDRRWHKKKGTTTTTTKTCWRFLILLGSTRVKWFFSPKFVVLNMSMGLKYN